STDNVSVTGEVAITCLNKAISYFHDHSDYLKNIAAMIFPLLLVMPQTQGLNLKALVLVNKINWPAYQNIAVSSSDEAKPKSVVQKGKFVKLMIIHRIGQGELRILNQS
ncbi:HEAT repeat-containing protein, partial [Trifolium medium]|nr:HEAT repeat-containing protein [Trifolium medium]